MKKEASYKANSHILEIFNTNTDYENDTLCMTIREKILVFNAK